MNEYGDRTSGDAASPASQVMSEALDLAIEEKSPFPDRSLFLDANVPLALRQPEMRRAAQEGTSVVLVSPDLSTRVLSPGEILGHWAKT
ncbi:MAG TPA: hypothetical protein VFM94_05520 [Solirubrobacterales bacterium]|nr:hypothetical protein [Solirubrobacterales bacterium]